MRDNAKLAICIVEDYYFKKGNVYQIEIDDDEYNYIYTTDDDVKYISMRSIEYINKHFEFLMDINEVIEIINERFVDTCYYQSTTSSVGSLINGTSRKENIHFFKMFNSDVLIEIGTRGFIENDKYYYDSILTTIYHNKLTHQFVTNLLKEDINQLIETLDFFYLINKKYYKGDNI